MTLPLNFKPYRRKLPGDSQVRGPCCGDHGEWPVTMAERHFATHLLLLRLLLVSLIRPPDSGYAFINRLSG
jgi:hypothetical protein